MFINIIFLVNIYIKKNSDTLDNYRVKIEKIYIFIPHVDILTFGTPKFVLFLMFTNHEFYNQLF